MASPGHNARSHSNTQALLLDLPVLLLLPPPQRTVANDSASVCLSIQRQLHPSTPPSPACSAGVCLVFLSVVPLSVAHSHYYYARCRAPLPLAEPNFPSLSPRKTTTTTTLLTHSAETLRPPANSLVIPTRTHCDIRCRRHMVFHSNVSPCSPPCRRPGTFHAPTSLAFHHRHHHPPA